MSRIISRNLSVLKEITGESIMKNGSSNTTSSGKNKIRRKAPIKIVLRRLPAAMTWEQLETQLNPIPEFEFAEFVAAKSSGGIAFSRAYFVFKDEEDIVPFKERFHGYVFVDSKGGESIGIVELAPNPKVPHNKFEDAKERDSKCGTIETDHEYKKFLSERENPQIPEPVPMEQLIREIDEREKMAEKNAVQETPLTQFMIKKNDERFKRIEEKRRLREEERRARVHRRLENEAKEKEERKDTKKVTEFRNSKFERSRESASKEKERTKTRTYRTEDYSRNGTIEKENKRHDSERGRESNAHSDKKGRAASADRDSFRKKAKHIDGNEYLKDDESERKKEAGGCKEIKKETSKKNEATSNEHVTTKDFTEPSSTKSTARVSKMIINRKAATKTSSVTAEKGGEGLAGKEAGKEGSADKIEKEPSKPRRNKDRPERAIYQPCAARRRAAALAATNSNATVNSATTVKEKP